MRHFAFVLAAAVMFAAATYTVTLQPGDSVTVTAPGAVTPTPIPTPVATIPLAVNLTAPDDWNMGARAKVFVDVMRTARLIGTNKYRVLTTSNNQAPDANWQTFGSRQPKIAGTYLLSWSGAATVTASGATVKNAAAGQADIVVLGDFLDVDLTFSAPVTNVVMLRPGYPRGTVQVTSNEFRAFVAPFTAIRFMDAQMTNWDLTDEPLVSTDPIGGIQKYVTARTGLFHGAQVSGTYPIKINDAWVDAPLALKLMDWQDRPTDNGSYHNRLGMSLEAVVRIANETKKNPWLSVYPNASDDMLTGMALYFAANLDPSLTAYFEWGNENPWNDIATFGQAKAIISQARADAKLDANLQNPPENAWYLGERWKVKRTIRASEIFRGVYGADFNRRVKFLVCGQFDNVSCIANALNWALRSYPNPPSYYLGGIAFAPYIGAGGTTTDQILAGLAADIATRKSVDSKLMNWRAVADAYQLPLYCYEAGIDLGQGITNLASRIAVAYDARAESTVKSYLDSCYFDAGLASLAWFNGVCTRDKWGPAWGLTDDAADLAQPMYAGTKTFAAQAAPTGGVTATFYKDTTFTTPLGTITVPLVNHRWQIWSTGGIWGRKDVTTTDARNGSIRFTGRYIGPGTLAIEREANDVATLTRDGDKFALDYKAIFDGNGIAWVRLVAGGAVVRQAQLLPT